MTHAPKRRFIADVALVPQNYSVFNIVTSPKETPLRPPHLWDPRGTKGFVSPTVTRCSATMVWGVEFWWKPLDLECCSARGSLWIMFVVICLIVIVSPLAAFVCRRTNCNDNVHLFFIGMHMIIWSRVHLLYGADREIPLTTISHPKAPH